MNAIELARHLGARKVGNGWMAKCVGHKDQTPSMKIDVGFDGRPLVKCFAGCDQASLVRELTALGLWGNTQKANHAPRPAAVERSTRARDLWHAASPAANTLVETYLQARGIRLTPPPTLRFVPNLNHVEAGDSFPAIIAAVTTWPNKRVSAVQRTYLKRDGSGKATVSPAKKSLGPTKGGAVRLAPAGTRLGLAEGIEDALSAMQAQPDLPCWAVLGVEGLRGIVLPELPLAQEIIILADSDKAGMDAANDAASRFSLEGRRVRIATPPHGAKDFNEALRLAGAT